MNTAVVTSFSAAGWAQYGRRFVETFCRFWPPEVALVCYSEHAESIRAEFEDAAGARAQVDLHDLYYVNHRLRGLVERHGYNALAHGREQRDGQRGWTPKKIADGYNFRYDAVRFAHKVFAIESAWCRIRFDARLFWVDADVITFAPVPATLFDELLPVGAALACLDRGEYHSECGFVGYNLRHPEACAFIVAFAELYASGEIFQLQEWHDSWVFDWLRRKKGTPTHAIPHQSLRHPFVNSALGACMDHLKGDRKKLARSPDHELTVRHEHAYWRSAA